MDESQQNIDGSSLSPDEKKRQLYEKQVELLKTFLERNAISQKQYEKSFHDLTEKMRFGSNI